MKLKELIHKNSSDFLELCETYEVDKLYGFGSAINSRFNDITSDIDLLVELKTEDPIQRGINLMNLWDQLELFFGRKVDLLTEVSIHNPILKENINATKILLYDGKRKEVFI